MHIPVLYRDGHALLAMTLSIGNSGNHLHLDSHFIYDFFLGRSMLKIILILIAAYVFYEVIEHAVIPLIWLITKRSRKSPTGESGMIGLEAEVREWKDNKGKVFVHGELWQAESTVPLAVGDTVRIQIVKGLTLIVEPWHE